MEEEKYKVPQDAKTYQWIIGSKSRKYILFKAFGYFWEYQYHFRLRRLMKL